MDKIQTVFSRPWSIRVPVLTRYLPSKFVAEFFDHGRLRLSSFKTFRGHRDEQRGDPREGFATQQITGTNVDISISAINAECAYVLCATTVETVKLQATFDTSNGIRILHPLRFADAISRHIPGFIGGVEGLCSYRDTPVLTKRDAITIKPPEAGQDGEALGRSLDRYVAGHATDSFFLKHASFSHQSEYRFIWFATGSERPYIDIACKEAVAFCERIPTVDAAAPSQTGATASPRPTAPEQ